MPGKVAINHEYLMRISLDWRTTDPANPILPGRRIQSGLAIKLFASRPIDILIIQTLLAYHARVAGARNRHAFEIVRAYGFAGGIQNRPWIHIAWADLLSGDLLYDKCNKDKDQSPRESHSRDVRPERNGLATKKKTAGVV
jgi:hypothetical protein